jgi:NADH-quinone oxidoreductase subunit K
MDAMLHISTLHYLVLGAALFLLGVIGVLTRRNVVIVLMSIELILNAVNLNLVALSRYWQGINGATALHGQVFAIFVLTDAAAEAAVGLGILIAFFRNKETINVDEMNLLKW